MKRHFRARLDETGMIPPVHIGNMPGKTWPMTIMALVKSGPADSIGREVHLVIDNEIDLDVLEYGIRAQRERLAMYGDTGRSRS